MVPALAVAFLIALAWAGLSVWLGPVLGWVDRPDDTTALKIHERPAVPLGGVGIFLAVHTAMAMTDRYDVGLAAATGMVLLLGLVDDRVGLSPKLRLIVEVAAGVVLVTTAEIGVHGWWGVLVGTALVVFAINAVNLYDGLDGLVGSTALISALGLAALATFGERVGLTTFFGANPDVRPDTAFGLVLAAALLGFLVLNWNPAKVFLGDNGAYSVAVFLSYGILRWFSAYPPPSGVSYETTLEPMVPLSAWIAMGLLGVFALDLIVTFARRKLNGHPLFEGDRSHVYDQLRDRGMPIKRIALTSAALQGGLVAVTVLAGGLIGGLGAVAVLVLVATGMLAIARTRGFLARTG
jgi:UDP-GlcNAc:undecaprenyl-phosphate GlcNAc-1-phosphate transferase